MKTTLLIPPAISLVLAGVWIVSQRQSIATLESESVILQKHIAAARSSGATPDDPGKPSSPAKIAKEKEPLDWKKIAAQISEMQRGGGMGDMRAMIKLQQRLQSMSKDELAAALDEIAALDLADESRNMLEQMLIGPLVQKDPEFALTKFIDRLEDQNGSMGWTLANGMREWAKEDPVTAAAWFDAQIAAGKFESKSLEGKSQSRGQFESALIQILLGSDPTAAAARLGAMPQDQRSDILSHHVFHQLKEEDQLAFAKLVRSQIPAENQGYTLAQRVVNFVGPDGYAKASGFLNRIEATSSERSVCVASAGEANIQAISYQKKVTKEDIDAMRKWANNEAPGTADGITGSALGSISQNGKMKFAETAELATHYHEASGNDDVLVSFLGSWQARKNKDEARLLAEKISDDKRRGEVLENLK